MKLEEFKKAVYRKKAFRNFPHWCSRCFNISKLEVHHIDGNRKNNLLSNLQILCKKCHQEIHGIGPVRKYIQQKGNTKFVKGTRRRKK